MTRRVSAEAEFSPVVCSGHKWRKAEKTPVPGEVHFQAVDSQEDFYKKKGEQLKKLAQDNFGCSAFKISLDAITCVWPLRALVKQKGLPT